MPSQTDFAKQAPESQNSPSHQELANAIRFLAIDAVQQANSGHPGMPMGMADIAEVLWNGFMQHNPKNPKWINRDRFILSNGHGCMLLYAVLHLTGYNLSIDDLRQFRQLHSKTPGHPEYGYTPGVETTTGPLGQGLANAVGMAIGIKHLAATFNRPSFDIFNHTIYAFAGDGCLMEGISHEACSLAGTLGLNKLIVFYDDNGISIDGEVKNWFSDNTPERFRAYGWQVLENINGHDHAAIHQAILTARQTKDKPTLICCKTIIGWGSPNKAGKASVHGAALGQTEVNHVRQDLAWSHEPFVIQDAVYTAWDARKKGRAAEEKWQVLFNDYAKKYPALAAEINRRFAQHLPDDWSRQADALIATMQAKKESIASRKASQICLNHFSPLLPELIGGSADLTESNCSDWQGMTVFTQSRPEGRYIHYGVREFGMSAIMNGLAQYGGIIPFGGTFLTFSDYARNAIRLAALMRSQVIFLYTHDSIGLGEDGPTHQPVEHIAGLRLIPHLSLWRPCDTVESAIAWRAALEHKGPTCLLFSRQTLPFQNRSPETIKEIAKGGYILQEAKQGKPKVILLATGSEVELAVQAKAILEAENIATRVVSMPSTDVFLQQDSSYQESVLPNNFLARVAIEAAVSNYWYQFVGLHGKVVGMDRFGASAPAKDVFRDCGFTLDAVVAAAKAVMLE